MTELQDLKPYKKDITWTRSKVRWCKVVDKNNVPLVNFDIAEDKADFIINCINNHDALLEGCQAGVLAINCLLKSINKICKAGNIPFIPPLPIDNIKKVIIDAGGEVYETAEQAEAAIAGATVKSGRVENH